MKILVDAYFNNNFGDDLLIYELIHSFPEHSFYLLDNENYASVLSYPDNVIYCGKILPSEKDFAGRVRNKLRSFLRLPKKEIVSFFKGHDYDVYLQYGGSIFMQTTKHAWKNKVRDYLYILSKFDSSAVIGCNFGPYSSDDFFRSHESLFRRFDLVTFRDSSSYNLFKSLPNTALGADIGLLAKDFLPFEASRDSDYFIVSPIDLSFRRGLQYLEPDYYKGMARLTCEFYWQTQKRAVLFAFCEGEGDIRACSTIKDEILAIDSSVDVEIVCHKSIEESLGVIANSSWIVGCRFHAVMVGISFGKRVLPVSYSKKIDNELQDLHYGGEVFHIKDTAAWDARSIVTAFCSSDQKCGPFLKSASKHFILLRGLLNDAELADSNEQ